MNNLLRLLCTTIFAVFAYFFASTVFAQAVMDDRVVSTRPYYVFEDKDFELEVLVASSNLYWDVPPSYLVEGANIAVFVQVLPGPGPSPAPPPFDNLFVQEVGGLPAGEYTVYLSRYWDEVPTAFDFEGTTLPPYGEITIYPGDLDLDIGLGSPKADEVVGGFGVIRGWACYSRDSRRLITRIGGVSYQIDNGSTKPVQYGSPRGDVTERCFGQSNTGFAAPINWNRFSLGEHTFKLFVDGLEVVNQNITVSGTGETFLRGLDAEYVLDDFPNSGDKTTVRWSQSAQDFTIIGVESE